MLNTYFKEVQKLRSLGRDWNLTDEEIERIIDESFRFLETDEIRHETSHRNDSNKQFKFFKISVAVCLIAVVSFLVASHRKTALNYVERNVQELIYPGMRLLRKAMLPVVKIFPSITELYDEACLVSNPYFKVTDIDCWPCHGVRSVLNLTTSNLESDEFHSGIPFILKDDNLKKVRYRDLKSIYHDKKSMFDRDAPNVKSTGHWSTSEDVFCNKPLNSHQSESQDRHISWKMSRLEPTRAIRTAFGYPKQVPHYISGVTPEKFILIDERHSPQYQIPETEGTTVFLVQGSGSRLIILDPSSECQKSCHRVSVLLTPHHILWYNWWYWRATSVPVESSHVGITYVGSYY